MNPPSPEARKFVENLVFSVRRTGPSATLGLWNMTDRPLGRDLGTGLATLTDAPVAGDEPLFHLYSIWSLPHRGRSGKIVLPRQLPPPTRLPGEIAALFEDYNGRRPNREETDFIAASIASAAAEAPEVALFAGALDLTLLNAVPPYVVGPGMTFFHYPWLADPAARAVRDFVVEYPLLAGIATAGHRLFEVAKATRTAGGGDAQAYAAILDHIASTGFTELNTTGAEATPPLSPGLLRKLKGVPPALDEHVLSDLAISRTGRALALAARIPLAAVRTDRLGFRGMALAGDALWALQLETDRVARHGDMTDVVARGQGFGMAFGPEEIGRVFGRTDFEGLSRRHGETSPAQTLARYVAISSGHGEWLRRALADGFATRGLGALDFAPLRKMLVNRGFGPAMTLARRAVTRHKPKTDKTKTRGAKT